MDVRHLGAVRLSRRAALRAASGTAVSVLGLGTPSIEGAAAVRTLGDAGTGMAVPYLPQAEYSPSVVVLWNQAVLQAIRNVRPAPPAVARALAVVHTSIYDAWAAYDGVAVGTRLSGFLRRPGAEGTLANKNQAVSFAAYRALIDLFPSEAPLFDRQMAGFGYDPTDGTLDLASPTGIGNLAAKVLLECRHGDGANQLGTLAPGAYSDYTGYVPGNDPDHINDPNRWQPLRVPDGKGGATVQQYAAPHWGLVTPFAMRSGDQFRPNVRPAQYPSEGYVRQAQEILDYSANLTDEQKVIAEYFADGPNSELPPGHWCLFAQWVSQRGGHDIDADVKLYFALSNALHDAGIAAWDAKRAFDCERPVTAIHYLFGGKPVQAWLGPYKGTGTMDGGNWQPYQAATVVSPPFPEPASGHSTFSAAGAQILSRFTGSDTFGASYTQPAGTSFVEPGLGPAADVTLTWATFSDAANMAGLSRRYGGIHFVEADLTGRSIGRVVGAQAWDKAQSYLRGTA